MVNQLGRIPCYTENALIHLKAPLLLNKRLSFWSVKKETLACLHILFNEDKKKKKEKSECNCKFSRYMSKQCIDQALMNLDKRHFRNSVVNKFTFVKVLV